jgi:hypothetical protein
MLRLVTAADFAAVLLILPHVNLSAIYHMAAAEDYVISMAVARLVIVTSAIMSRMAQAAEYTGNIAVLL